MKIGTSSTLFKETFGAYPSLADQSLAVFHSEGPTFSAIKNAFLDESTASLYSDAESLNGIQSQDVRNGLRLFMRDLAVGLETDAGQPNISINCPSSLLANGLKQVVNSAEIGSVLSDQTVLTIFSGVASGDPKKVGVALVGVGMAAVGVSIPVVGWIGAAITIVATALSAAFNRAKATKAADDAARARQLYAEFPPMQVADADMDGCVGWPGCARQHVLRAGVQHLPRARWLQRRRVAHPLRRVRHGKVIGLLVVQRGVSADL